MGKEISDELVKCPWFEDMKNNNEVQLLLDFLKSWILLFLEEYSRERSMFSGLGCFENVMLRDAKDILHVEFALYPSLPLIIYFSNYYTYLQ